MSNQLDPGKIAIRQLNITIDHIIRKLEKDEIDLHQEFQRDDKIWTDEQQSRFIESTLIQFPLPVFYFDENDSNKWFVIDGAQRINAWKRFILSKELKLKGLEFFPELEGQSWDNLSRSYQRQIEESHILVYKMDERMDAHLRFNLYKRINTEFTLVPLSTVCCY